MKIPAKVNLYLNITGKRADGYHLLDSLIAFTDVYDEVDISASSGFALEITGPFAKMAGREEDNIVTKAARAMANKCGGRKMDIEIKLVKNIPAGAGLGGGSADAAATILLLKDLWQAGLSAEELAEIGLALGADVPVFLGKHTAIISGIGENTSKTKVPEFYAVLVYPGKPLSTKEVYQSFRLDNAVSEAPKANLPSGLDIKEWVRFLQNQKNDLEIPAIGLMPEIGGIINKLKGLEGCHFARMSGSGSACFGLFSDKNKAQVAMESFKNNYWVRLAKICNSY